MLCYDETYISCTYNISCPARGVVSTTSSMVSKLALVVKPYLMLSRTCELFKMTICCKWGKLERGTGRRILQHTVGHQVGQTQSSLGTAGQRGTCLGTDYYGNGEAKGGKDFLHVHSYEYLNEAKSRCLSIDPGSQRAF